MPNIFHPQAFAGRVYGVTGGTRGIGAAVVEMLCGLGASVLAIGRDPAALRTLDEKLGGKVLGFPGDVSDALAMQKALQLCLSRFGRLDGWVNNAMYNPGGKVGDEREEDFVSAWQINTLSAWRMAKECLIGFNERGGAIVNVSSIMASQTLEGNAAYTSSKAALEGLTRALAIEFAPRRIRVNTIVPGYIRTHSGYDIGSAGRQTKWQKVEEKISDIVTEYSHPWPDTGKPEDVAAAIVFLLSDGAAFITGASLIVDGGLFVDLRDLRSKRRRGAIRKLERLPRVGEK